MNDNEVILNLYPVCECGQVIKNLITREVLDGAIYDDDGNIIEFLHAPLERYIHTSHVEFEPHICPNCGKHIVGLRGLDIEKYQKNLDFTKL